MRTGLSTCTHVDAPELAFAFRLKICRRLPQPESLQKPRTSVAEAAKAMATLALPLRSLASPLPTLHTSRHTNSSTLTPSFLSTSASFPASRLTSYLSGSYRVSSRWLALRRDDIGSNSGNVSVKGEEHCSGSGRSAQEEALVLERVSGVSAFAVAALLTSARSSLADEVAASPVDGSDVGISTTVSVLFVAATVGLIVLTGGVIYLGLTEFLEKRALQEEQKKVEAAKSKKEKPTKQAVKTAARAGGPKGFGSGRRTGTKGDDEEVSN